MISQKSQNEQNKCFFRGPLFVLKTTTTTNFTQLTILVASVGRFDLLYFLNDWLHGLRLTTFCYDSRSLTREKRTEKKHEKKFKSSFQTYTQDTINVHSVAILQLKNIGKLLCKCAAFYQILMERFQLKSRPPRTFGYLGVDWDQGKGILVT